MKKRIIALFALVAMMVTMLTAPVSAALIVNDTFNTPPSSGDLADVSGWAPYSDSMAGTHVFTDGAVKFTPPSNTRLFWHKSYTLPETQQNHILMFDAKYSDSHNINWQLFATATGGDRIFQQSVNTRKTNTWIRYIIVVTQGGKAADMYWCERDAETQSWNKVSNTKSPLTTRDATGFRIGFDCYTLSGNMWIDNVCAYTGDFTEFDGFKLGSAEVDDITDINAAGTLKADYELYTDDVSFAAGSTANTYVLQSKSVKTIMVAFDKNMKMLDCEVKNVSLTAGANTLSNELTIGDTSTADNYYGNVSDSGYVGLYFWDGMQPFCEAKILN